MLSFKNSGFIILTLFPLLLCTTSNAAIILEDRLCIAGEEIMLSAETKKGLFRKGGVVVEFFINKRSIGKSLSGGDGMAYKAFIPLNTGLMKLSVKDNDEEAKALMLCLKKGQAILLIDIETAKETPFSSMPRKDSREVIKRLSRRFPVVYLLTGFMSQREAKGWLQKNGYPLAPVLAFKEEIFSELKEMGLLIRAVIASPQIAELAASYRLRIFSFDEVEGAIEVDSWKELEKKI
ncbi:MAG: hypothetical protein ACK4TF_04140 [Thermodesulfovibrionales bacterium]